jgi:competence protein ComEC
MPLAAIKPQPSNMKPTLRIERVIFYLAVIAAVVTFAFVLSLSFGATVTPAVSVDFLDVGQGDAALIRYGTTETLIDTGPDRSVLVGLGKSMPFFDRVIETVVITHPHADHYEGLAAVIERYHVNRLVMGSTANMPQRLAEVVAAAQASGTVVEIATPGAIVNYGSGVVLRNESSTKAAQSEDVNDRTLIMDLVTPCAWVGRPNAPAGCEAVLFMGDAGQALEADVEKKLLGRVQILKVGHHGSAHGTSKKFLEVADPVDAIISVGPNTYGHPSPLTLKRLGNEHTQIFRTDLNGKVRATFQPGKWLIRAER